MIKNFEKVYKIFNDEFFKGQLPKPNFSVDMKKRGVLCFKPPSNIVLCKDFPESTLVDIFDNIIHQMVHIENYLSGIEDFSSSQYHKKSFYNRALQIGLNLAYSTTQGWSIVYSTLGQYQGNVRLANKKNRDKLKEVYSGIQINIDQLIEFQNDLKLSLDETTVRKSLLKYVCQCKPPHNTIRSGRRPNGPRPLDIKCNICGEKFVVKSDF